MAGFQFDVPCEDDERKLLGELLSAIQKRARKIEVEIRYQYQNAHVPHYSISIDGSLRAIQSFVSSAIESEMMIVFAEAHCQPNSIVVRRSVARRLIKNIKQMTAYSTAMVANTSQMLGGFPNSYFFEYNEKSDVAYPLASFTGILILYHVGRVGTTPIVEAAHTALEALLNNLTPHLKPKGKQKWISFPEKVDEVGSLNYIDNPSCDPEKMRIVN